MASSPRKQKRKKHRTQSSVWRLGVFSILSIFAIIFLFMILNPFYGFIIPRIPHAWQAGLFGDIYRSIPLAEKEQTLSTEQDYAPAAPLPVLGDETGVCFSFYSTISQEDKTRINAKRLRAAARGRTIAEITVTDANGIRYTLHKTSMDEPGELLPDGSFRATSSICQTFGREYPSLPDTIVSVRIRPIKPFAPYKILWVSARNLEYE